jgi:hypothetical protein
VLAYNEMQGREQALVKFRGKVAIDPSIVAGIKSIAVGATSGQWTQSATPNAANPTVDVFVEDLHVLCIRLRRIANAHRGRRRI